MSRKSLSNRLKIAIIIVALIVLSLFFSVVFFALRTSQKRQWDELEKLQSATCAGPRAPVRFPRDFRWI